ncbi:unnamed protein product [Rotaria sp. Silwood2]|nr:unnamed protein product [Rotaria sp. Silwood2]CAF4483485.1 unnamed protein product [Rotaria sp. Silwood2]
MENIYPLGIRPGESIIVTPSQTLSNDEYYLLRNVSIKVARHLGIVGVCNVQFALHPSCNEYYIIGINPRLSRSSAFESKVTGYPLAYIVVKLTLGMNLAELINHITKSTCACFEPSLDYVTIKASRKNLSKSIQCSKKFGNFMKSNGEVMSIGRSFEEAFQQALRMVNEHVTGFDPYPQTVTDNELSALNYQYIFLLAKALQQRYTIERLSKLTQIDPSILDGQPLLYKSKVLAFSDLQIAHYTNCTPNQISEKRKKNGIRAYIKQIDTVGGACKPAKSYFYFTYTAKDDDVRRIITHQVPMIVIGHNDIQTSDTDLRLLGTSD